MGSMNLVAARRLVARGSTTSEAVLESGRANEGPRSRLQRWEQLEAGRLGMNPQLLALVRHPDVTDVLVSASGTWADFGGGLTRVDAGVDSEAQARRLAVQMAAAASRRLDDAEPIVDAVLPGPLRLHAVLPPIAGSGTAISLRVLRPRPFSLADLVEKGSVTESLAEQLEGAVSSGKSLLIAGATGAGKTTLMATLLGLVDPRSRIVAIEEVSELAVDHPHVVRLQARAENIEGEGGVGLEDLVRAAVRMRPDRLVLGECRGPEVREVLTALNTGHEGGMATIHANSIEDVPSRLLALGLLAGMEHEAVAAMAQSAFSQVIFMKRDVSGLRFVESLGELAVENGRLRGVVTATATGETYAANGDH